MRLRRPSTGDRMDLAEERQYRRRQPEADLIIEKAGAAQYERDAAAGRRMYEDGQPYNGSRLQREHRRGGS